MAETQIVWQVAYEARDNHFMWWDLSSEVSEQLTQILQYTTDQDGDIILDFVWQWGDGTTSPYAADVKKLLVQNKNTGHCRPLRQITILKTRSEAFLRSVIGESVLGDALE